MSDGSQLTRILRSDAEPSPDDVNEIMPMLYAQLRELASAYLRHERADHTLQPTALVHEAYMRLVDQTEVPWSDAMHFRGIAARVMRQVLVDHARKHGALKRGGGHHRITLTAGLADQGIPDLDVLELEHLLVKLAGLDERKARTVELLFFGGMTHREAARMLGVSRKTVEADWYMARAWLSSQLGKDD